jgi:hypothetical protein
MALSTAPDHILRSLRAGKKLVTAEKTTRRPGRRSYKRFLCELGGELVSPTVVRALIACREVVEVPAERTASTRTWAVAESK